MGQGKSKTKSKLIVGADKIIVPISELVLNGDLQFMIIEYLGQGTIVWIVLFSSVYNNEMINNTNKSISESKDNKNKNIDDKSKNIDIMETNNKRLMTTLNNNYNKILSAAMTGIPENITIGNFELGKIYSLEAVIAFYGNCTALQWLYNIGYTPHNNCVLMWYIACESNKLELCELIYSISGVDDFSKEIALDCFIDNKKLGWNRMV